MIHASGCFIVPYWLRGGVAAVLPGFTPASYLDAVERWKPTALNLVPTMIGMLLDHPGIEQADFSTVKSIIYGASPMPRPVMQRALKLWGPRFAQYYGQSEAPIFITHLTQADHVGPKAEQRLASCGRRRSIARSSWSTKTATRSRPARRARLRCARRLP